MGIGPSLKGAIQSGPGTCPGCSRGARRFCWVGGGLGPWGGRKDRPSPWGIQHPLQTAPGGETNSGIKPVSPTPLAFPLFLPSPCPLPPSPSPFCVHKSSPFVFPSLSRPWPCFPCPEAARRPGAPPCCQQVMTLRRGPNPGPQPLHPLDSGSSPPRGDTPFPRVDRFLGLAPSQSVPHS